MKTFKIGKNNLSIDEILHIANSTDCRIEFHPNALQRMIESSDFFDKIEKERIPCYGINRGFGDLLEFEIKKNEQNNLQTRLVLSHAVGVGKAFDTQTTRLIFLLRLMTFATGATGIKPKTAQMMMKLFNAGAFPEIAQSGSLGASGDLSPLAQFASFFLGEGFGFFEGEKLPAKEIIQKVGVEPIHLSRKEGLSIINGTSAMTAVGISLKERLQECILLFMSGMSLFLETGRFNIEIFNEEAYLLKPYPGAKLFSRVLRNLLAETKSKDKFETRLQDAYSLRCAPLIASPVFDAIDYLDSILTIEANAADDNPLFLKNQHIVFHGGHFHGGPLSFALDQARIAITIIANLIDRQLEYFFDKKYSGNISPFFSFSPEKGHPGFAGLQYLATSLAIEIRHAALPFIIQTLPTNGGNQDYVSLGLQSGLSGIQMIEKLEIMIHIYYLAAMQGMALLNKEPLNHINKNIYKETAKIIELPYIDNVKLSNILMSFTDSKLLKNSVISDLKIILLKCKNI